MSVRRTEWRPMDQCFDSGQAATRLFILRGVCRTVGAQPLLHQLTDKKW